ncbi:adrenocorticotropic hormone receptor-like [Exaiptasia diaphana]|uniref:G-protein coupled receptors family 1 profile domain-containing protein n=1 Tax=Exaiptasia diaphana TaxID=2652724 RepID=A0A913XVA6_EXADI|nr:adrenocorticotropic hormone receptor-like [Exaiptasia diaphana]
MESNSSKVFDNLKPLPCPPLSSPFVRLSASDNQHDLFLMTILLVNFLLSLLTILTNFVVVFTIIKTPNLQTPSNILILNLAVTDFFVGVIAEPFTCASKYAELKRNVQLLCSNGLVVSNCLWVLSLMSLIALTAITVDRFLAIHLHLRYRQLITTRRYAILHFSIWVFIATVGVARILYENQRLYLPFSTILYASLSLTTLCFIFKINRVIKRHSSQIHAQLNSSTVPISTTINMPKIKKSVIVMMMTLGAFLACYIPYFGIMITFIVVKEPSIAKGYASNITITMVKINSLINPIIYCWRIRELRSAAFRILRKICS